MELVANIKESISFYKPDLKSDTKIIGLKRNDWNGLDFVFPCKYQVDDSNYKNEAKKLLRLITEFKSSFEDKSGNNGKTNIASMIWIIQDYINNGYYIEQERISLTNSKGKVDWKRTLNNRTIWLDNGNIIFPDVYRYKNIQVDNLITEIYKYCLYYSIEMLGGWFVPIDQSQKSIFNEKDCNLMKSIISEKLSNTFSDNKRVLFLHIKNILDDVGLDKRVLYGLNNNEFEYVFEGLVNEMFGSEKVNQYYNQYVYEIDGGKYKASKLRPDTIYMDDKRFFILDAKYYGYGYSNNGKDLPESSSIIKQASYQNFLAEHVENIGDKAVKSIFVLPFSKKEGEDIVQHIGHVNVITDNEGMQNYDKLCKRIEVVKVDLKSLVDCHFKDIERDFVKDLIDALPL